MPNGIVLGSSGTGTEESGTAGPPPLSSDSSGEKVCAKRSDCRGTQVTDRRGRCPRAVISPEDRHSEDAFLLPTGVGANSARS